MISTELIRWRQTHGYDRGQFALLFGVSKTTVKRWEHETLPIPAILGKLLQRATPDVLAQLEWLSLLPAAGLEDRVIALLQTRQVHPSGVSSPMR